MQSQKATESGHSRYRKAEYDTVRTDLKLPLFLLQILYLTYDNYWEA